MAMGGGDSNGPSYYPSISADGRYIAYESGASNLVAADTDYKRDVFVYDRVSRVTERVSVSSAGVQGNRDSGRPSISADGHFVAFASSASNLAPGDSGLASDIFVRDRWTNSTELVSVSSAGIVGNAASLLPVISSYGRYVAFSSVATNLVTGDTNGRADIFVHERSVSSPLADFALSSQTVAGCKNLSATITLSEPAPDVGYLVRLEDTLPALQTPATVLIPAGASKKTISIKTSPVATTANGTVSASLGDQTISVPLAIRPIGPLSLTLLPSTVVGGLQSVGTAKLECAAGPGPVTVDLSSSNSAVAAAIAASIVVPQGLSSAKFDVTTSPVLAKTSATLSATANSIKKSKVLNVTPAAVVSPTSLKFGSVAVGATSATQTTTLTNRGALPFSVTSVGLIGTSASWFLLQNNCPANLPAGGSCTIGVQFKPISAVSKSVKLSIATSATSTPLGVSLSGTGL